MCDFLLSVSSVASSKAIGTRFAIFSLDKTMFSRTFNGHLNLLLLKSILMRSG